MAHLQKYITSINEKKSLARKKQQTELSVSNLKEKNAHLRRLLVGIRAEVNGYKASAQYEGKLAQANEKKVKAEAQLKKDESMLKSAVAQLEKINKQLCKCDVLVNSSDVAEHQKENAKLLIELDEYQSIIATKQETLGSLVAVNNTQGMREQRKEILADIATGKDRKKELDSLDGKIQEQQKQDLAKNSKMEKQASDERQTISGLNAKVAGVQARINENKYIGNELIKHFILSLADEEKQNYQQMAKLIEESMCRLIGMDRLVKGLGFGDTAILPSSLTGWRLVIPSLAGQTEGVKNENHIVNFGSSDFVETEKTIDRVKDDLSELGITL